MLLIAILRYLSESVNVAFVPLGIGIILDFINDGVRSYDINRLYCHMVTQVIKFIHCYGYWVGLLICYGYKI